MVVGQVVSMFALYPDDLRLNSVEHRSIYLICSEGSIKNEKEARM